MEEAGEGEGKKAVGKPSLLAKWLDSLEMPRDVVPRKESEERRGM